MINANLEQFLDNGWYNEATLFYKGHTYWCEGCYNRSKDNPFHFWVYRYKSILVKEKNGKTWSKREIKDDDVADFSTVFEIWTKSEEDAKELFLQAAIFDGKSFWEIEEELAWYDETN